MRRITLSSSTWVFIYNSDYEDNNPHLEGDQGLVPWDQIARTRDAWQRFSIDLAKAWCCWFIYGVWAPYLDMYSAETLKPIDGQGVQTHLSPTCRGLECAGAGTIARYVRV